ncbi:MAG: hypothetical protein R3E46_18045 [Sedimenticolaceae bacterium]
MFNFFKSKRERLKDQADAAFKNFIPSLQGMAPDEIAFVLDLAAHIKESSLLTEPDDSLYWAAFEDPCAIPEDRAISMLHHWKNTMYGWSGSPQDMAKVGALSIWWLSLAAGTIPEVRVQGRAMWGELSRGFPLCQYENPVELIPNGLEPA